MNEPNSTITRRSPASIFSEILGNLFLIEGVWGFFSPVVLGLFTTNRLHAVIHVVLGVAGIWAGRTGRARGYLGFVGTLLIVVALLWFIPGTRNLVVELFNVNQAVAILNLLVGVVALAIRRSSAAVVRRV